MEKANRCRVDQTWKNIPKHIQSHGCTVLAIQDPDDHDPSQSFSYTIGLTEQGLPELLVIGLPTVIAHTLLMDAFQASKAAAQPPVDAQVAAGIANMPLIYKTLSIAEAGRYALWAHDYYNWPVPMVKLVWPDPQGKYPWEESCEPGNGGNPEYRSFIIFYDWFLH